MMLLTFLLSKKITSFFSLSKNIWSLTMWMLSLVGLFLFSIGFGKFYDLTVEKNLFLNQESIIKLLNYLVFGLPIFLKFFPSISQRVVLAYDYHPLTNFKKAALELSFTIFSKSMFSFITLFGICTYLSSNYLSIHKFSRLLLMGYCGILFAENLLSSYFSNKRFYQITLGVLLITFIVVLNASQLLILSNLSIFIFNILLIGFYINFYSQVKLLDVKKSRRSVLKVKSISFNLGFRNKKYRATAIFSIILQIAFNFVYFKYLRRLMPNLEFYMLSPVVLFTYCFNNLWGYFKSTAINMLIAGNEIHSFIVMYIKLLIPPFMINLLLAGITVMLTNITLDLKMACGLITAFVFIIISGIIFSLLKMRHIKKSISLNSNNFNTNLLPLYIFGGSTLLLGILYQYSNLFWSLIFILNTSSFLMLYLLYFKNTYFMEKYTKTLLQT